MREEQLQHQGGGEDGEWFAAPSADEGGLPQEDEQECSDYGRGGAGDDGIAQAARHYEGGAYAYGDRMASGKGQQLRDDGVDDSKVHAREG